MCILVHMKNKEAIKIDQTPKPGELKVWFIEFSDTTGGKHAVEEDHGQGQVMCRLYKLPNGFYDHHTARLLPGGVVDRVTRAHSYVWLSPGDLHELQSDAYHYSVPDGTPGMIRPAQTMLKALKQQTPEGIWVTNED